MAAFVARELRRREARAAKGRGGPPALRLAELAEQFPGLSEGAVRGRLKERLPDVEVGARGGEGAEVLIGLRAGGRLPVEGELRRLVTPDQWCGHEAMRAGLLRLAASGVAAHERLAALPPERLRAAAEQLLPAPVRRQAAAAAPLRRCRPVSRPRAHARRRTRAAALARRAAAPCPAAPLPGRKRAEAGPARRACGARRRRPRWRWAPRPGR
jgi:hypothetical protein